MKFNSQICTTRKQSERLIALGLKKETADMALVPLMEWDDCTAQEYFTGEYVARTKKDVERYNLDYIPAWSFGRLIEMMPPLIEGFYPFSLIYNIKNNTIGYVYVNEVSMQSFKGVNIFDNVIFAISWLIKEGYFNKEYLV